MHSPSAAVALDSPAGTARAWRRPEVVALALAACAACVLRYDADAHGFISGFTAAVLVVLAATDLSERIIPNRIVLPAAAIVLLAQLVFHSDRAAEWLIAATAAALFLFIPTLVRSGAIGMGDVKLALLLGASLGFAVLPAMTLGFVAMLPVAVYLLVREGSAARKMYLPLGPFLAFGTIAVLLGGAAA